MLGTEGTRTRLGVALALGHEGFTPVRAGHGYYIFHDAPVRCARLSLHFQHSPRPCGEAVLSLRRTFARLLPAEAIVHMYDVARRMATCLELRAVLA